MNDPSIQETDAFAFEEKIHLRNYWYVIIERRWLVIFIFALLMGGIAYYLKEAPRIYLASTRLQIEQGDQNPLNLKGVNTIDTRDEVYIQTQISKIQSSSLLRSVLKEMRWGDAPSPQVEVELVKGTHLVDVKVYDKDPDKSAEVANRLAETFIKTNLSERLGSTTEALKWLQAEADNLKAKAQESDLAVQEYKRKHNTVSFDSGDNVLMRSLQNLQVELDTAEMQAAAALKKTEQLNRYVREGIPLGMIRSPASTNAPLPGDNPKYGTAGMIRGTNEVADYSMMFTTISGISDPAMNQLVQMLGEREAALAALKSRYKDKYPSVVEMRRQIDHIKEAIKKEAERLLAASQVEADNAQSKVQMLKDLLSQWKKRQMEFSDLKIEHDALLRVAEQSKLLHSALLSRMKETELLGSLPSNSIRVIEPAKVPIFPAKPHMVQVLVLGIALSLMTALGLAFFVDYIDDTIKSQSDVEEYLQQQFLGYIPKVKGEARQNPWLLAHLAPQTIGAESFRALRAALSLTYTRDQLHVLSVTSAMPDEGKSYMAVNLATVIAQTGVRTLLVDVDFRKPTLHQVFKLPRGNGLSSYLIGKTQALMDIIHTTDIPNLDVICAGNLPGAAVELAGSEAMKLFLSEIRQKYDRVVLDCPPVSAVSDALVVSAQADGVVFVTRFSRVRKTQARRCLQRLQEARIFICGVVTNCIDFTKNSHYADEYYHSNYYQAQTKNGEASES